MSAEEILKTPGVVLMIDWPSAELPDAFVRAGWTVHVKSGPGPEDFTVRELSDGAIVTSPSERPERVDLLYVHRPLEELPQILEQTHGLGARALWYQSGLTGNSSRDPRGCWLTAERSRWARGVVESAGLSYVDDVYVGERLQQGHSQTGP